MKEEQEGPEGGREEGREGRGEEIFFLPVLRCRGVGWRESFTGKKEVRKWMEDGWGELVMRWPICLVHIWIPSSSPLSDSPSIIKTKPLSPPPPPPPPPPSPLPSLKVMPEVIIGASLLWDISFSFSV